VGTIVPWNMDHTNDNERGGEKEGKVLAERSTAMKQALHTHSNG